MRLEIGERRPRYTYMSTTPTQFRPLYAHDCPECRYLGTVRWAGIPRDLYVCPGDPGGPSVVARFGDEGPDYSSAPVELVDTAPSEFGPLGVARELAR